MYPLQSNTEITKDWGFVKVLFLGVSLWVAVYWVRGVPISPLPSPKIQEPVDLHQYQQVRLFNYLLFSEVLTFLGALRSAAVHCYSPAATALKNIASAPTMRYPVYMSVISQAFDLRQILISMSKINWEVKDVMSQHNSYIDMILREVHIFTLRLEDVATKVPISQEVHNNLWENMAHIITHTLVQGFSEAKKCSNGGRALMQLDFTQFLSKFEKISSMRPMPHKEYVEKYVKAYYLPEVELEKWIKEHKEYSSKHLLGLVNCACQNNKKTKQRLLQIIEDMDKSESVR